MKYDASLPRTWGDLQKFFNPHNVKYIGLKVRVPYEDTSEEETKLKQHTFVIQSIFSSQRYRNSFICTDENNEEWVIPVYRISAFLEYGPTCTEEQVEEVRKDLIALIQGEKAKATLNFMEKILVGDHFGGRKSAKHDTNKRKR